VLARTMICRGLATFGLVAEAVIVGLVASAASAQTQTPAASTLTLTAALERALASDEIWCINVVLDPEAYRKSGQVSMAI